MLEKLRTIREERAAEDRGFTLIELLVVVVIIGILVAIAIPLYLNYQKGAHDRSAQSDLRNAIPALQQCYSENANAYPPASAGTLPTGTPLAGGVTGFVFATITGVTQAITDFQGATTLVCSATDTEKINLSDQSHANYTLNTDGSYELDVWNTGGKSHTTSATAYKYVSTSGGVVGP